MNDPGNLYPLTSCHLYIGRTAVPPCVWSHPSVDDEHTAGIEVVGHRRDGTGQLFGVAHAADGAKQTDERVESGAEPNGPHVALDEGDVGNVVAGLADHVWVKVDASDLVVVLQVAQMSPCPAG